MIEIHNVTKKHGKKTAVEGVSFTAKPGRVTGFLGPNGAGKSTTMRLILGLDRPTSGEVTVNGRAYRDLPAPIREVGALLDAGAVHGGRSARQHLRWVAQASDIPVRRVDEVLDLVGLSDVAGKRVGTFSLGMSQRLGIATALLGDPPVLMFDEPLNGLDAEGIIWFRNLVKQLAREGRTVLVSSHLMSEMQEMADHVLVIGRGRLIADASIAELTRQAGGSAVKVVSPQGAALRPLLEAAGASVVSEQDGSLIVTGMVVGDIGALAAQHRIALHELAPRRASLEAAFMAVTEGSVEYQAKRSPLGAAALAGQEDGTDV